MNSETTTIIQQAWQMRMAQDFEGFETHMAELGHRLGLPLEVTSSEQAKVLLKTCSSAKFDHVVQSLLLSASWLRAQAQLDLSQELLASVEAALLERAMPLCFHLPFQRALNYCAKGDSSVALEYFLLSRRHAQELEEELYALINSMFCLDNLGLPYARTEQEIDRLLQAHKGQVKWSGPFLKTLDQLDTFKAKIQFRSGQIEEILGSTPNYEYGQFQYMQMWASALPYHSGYKSFELIDTEPFYLHSPYFYKRSYRMRTLQGLLHPTDFKEINLTEFADRIYLWTWWWMIAPDKFPITHLLSLLKAVDLKTLPQVMTDEDYYLLKNSLYWICLFDSHSFEKIKKTVNLLKFDRRHPPALLALENDVQSYLLAIRNSDKKKQAGLKRKMQLHPLWNHKYIYFSLIVRGLGVEESGLPDYLSNFVGNLRKLLNVKEIPSCLKKQLVVDATFDKVLETQSKKIVISEPMVKAFQLLHGKQRVSCEEFLLVTFGIRGYDSMIHDPKIFNLLARMRAFKVNDLRFGVKLGYVFASGDWSSVKFVDGVQDDCRPDRHMEWQSFVEESQGRYQDEKDSLKRWLNPQLLLRKLSGQLEFSRKDIEELAGISRSSANRLINSWLKEGVLSSRGQARSRVYFLSNRLEEPKS